MVANFRLPHFETLCVRVHPFKFFASIGELSGQCLLSMLVLYQAKLQAYRRMKGFLFYDEKE